MISESLFYDLIILIVILLGAAMILYVIRLWFSLRTQDEWIKKVKGNQIAISKLRGDLNKKTAATPATNTSGGLPDLSTMTLEDAAEMLGFDKKELNNPLVRPIAEKAFNALKAKQQNPEEQEFDNYGY